MKITIDDREIEAEKGQTILEVAQKAGIEIPTLCYNKALSPYGACRLCTVEMTKGKRSKLVTACTYPVEDGITVKTKSERVLKARRVIMELLLARCPNSDEIKELAARMGVVKSRFRTLGDPTEKCILCGLCVRTCQELMEVNAIGFAGRGMKRDITTPFDKLSDICTTCGACEFVCPTNSIKLNEITGKKPVPLLSEFNMGLISRPAIYKPFPQAVPNVPKIDRDNCMHFLKGSCGACERFCDAKAIKYDQEDETEKLDVGSIILAPGFNEFDPSLKREYGYGIYPNVVSSIEFERLLSASGPSGGHVQRPSDGKTPKKIAFIQCVGSRDANTNEYCSSVCCMYAIKEAIVIKEHAPGVEPHIFFMDIRAFGKEFDDYYTRAKEEYDVRFTRCRAANIEETENNDLILSYVENGEPKEEKFDFAVLSVGLEAPRDSQELSEKLGIELNKYNFCSTKTFSPLETSKPGVYVCGVFSGPKDIPDTVAQASGAAVKASSLISSERGKLVTIKEYPPEKKIEGAAPRIGVFVCHCGINIGGVVDVPAVTEYARTLPNVVYGEDNLYTCSQDTQERIKEQIKEQDLNRVIVASCTPRTHEPLFQETLREAGLNPYLFEFVNIRDQCSWVHMHEPERATEKAKDLVRMGVAKARLLEPLQREKTEVTPSALVLGGGLSGMIAALEIAKQGFEVHLVEKESDLGGNLRKLHYLLSGEDPKKKLKELIKEVEENQRIHAYTNTIVTNVEGYIGNFKTTLMNKNENKVEIEHGAVVVATGGEEYKPKEYLYGEDTRVITQLELEEKMSESNFETQKVVMIQCVGSRNDERTYCSRVCCAQAIKNALKIKEKNPDSNVYILYKDVRAYGFNEAYYKEASENGVIFFRYDDENKPKVERENGILKVSFLEPILNEEFAIEPDLLVLSAATLPPKGNEYLAKMLKVPLSKDGFFLEAHMKLRPVEFATDGIFLCGLAHSPKPVDESISQACAAASKVCTILSKPFVEGEGIIARVNEALCSGCGLCVEICPYKAISLDEKTEKATINSALCKCCGACVAGCRMGAIQQKGFEDREILNVLDAALLEEFA